MYRNLALSAQDSARKRQACQFLNGQPQTTVDEYGMHVLTLGIEM